MLHKKLLDEPTAGLDPAERQRFLNILREISTENIVIFSTHIVEDIKELCTDMAIMNQGKILQHAPPQNAIANLKGHIWTKAISKEELALYEAQYTVLSSSYNRDNSIQIRIYSTEQVDTSFQLAKVGLEDVYFTSLIATAGHAD